jgi:hypothetical protein
LNMARKMMNRTKTTTTTTTSGFRLPPIRLTGTASAIACWSRGTRRRRTRRTTKGWRRAIVVGRHVPADGFDHAKLSPRGRELSMLAAMYTLTRRGYRPDGGRRGHALPAHGRIRAALRRQADERRREGGEGSDPA